MIIRALLATLVAAPDTTPRLVDIACVPVGTAASPQIAWQGNDGSLQWAEWRVRLGARAIPVRVIVARIKPERFSWSLEISRNGNSMGPWSIDKAPANARIALNAGQFTDDGPWGWVVHRGREWQAPGKGTLAGAFYIDSLGKTGLLNANEIALAQRTGQVREAVQSYPTLLIGDGIPAPEVCGHTPGVDRTHRDTRLAIGTLANGDLLIVMTRFDGLGETAARLPIGPTTPEMAAIMRSLGSTRALMLDGGLSSQLMLRDTAAGAQPLKWPGLRTVPLALVGIARE